MLYRITEVKMIKKENWYLPTFKVIYNFLYDRFKNKFVIKLYKNIKIIVLIVVNISFSVKKN